MIDRDADTKDDNIIPSPAPTVQAEFHVEPHPDPIVRELISEVERLRQENADLKEQLHGSQSR